MRALITASFDAAARTRLERLMEVVHEDWKERGTIYFDGAEFAAHIRDVGADVLIIEADLVHAEVLNGCRLRMIGCCRGDPVNVDLELATAKGVPVFHAPGRNADAVADLTLAFILMLVRHLPAVQEAFRGGTVRLDSAGDYLALYSRLTGAALDVLSDEPLRPGHRFNALPSVVVTPHIGGATLDVVRHQSEIVVEAIERYLRGERPRWIANPAVLDGRL